MSNVSFVARTVATGVLCAMLGACLGGGGGGGDAPATPAPSIGDDGKPTISGSPPATISEGSNYEFTPDASDPEGESLTFQVQNAPSWATFDDATGKLSGTPTAANVGSYTNIVISASDGSQSASLPAFSIDVLQRGASVGSAAVSWSAPTTNIDGSPASDIAGYKVYYGRASGDYSASVDIPSAGVASAVIEDLAAGTWYFAVTALDSSGAESDPSNEASKLVE